MDSFCDSENSGKCLLTASTITFLHVYYVIAGLICILILFCVWLGKKLIKCGSDHRFFLIFYLWYKYYWKNDNTYKFHNSCQKNCFYTLKKLKGTKRIAGTTMLEIIWNNLQVREFAGNVTWHVSTLYVYLYIVPTS